MYRKAVSEIWSRFKNKFRVPRYADLPAINSPTPSSTSAPWSCAAPNSSKTTATYRFRPSCTAKWANALAHLIAIDEAMDVWRTFAKR